MKYIKKAFRLYENHLFSDLVICGFGLYGIYLQSSFSKGINETRPSNWYTRESHIKLSN